MTVRNSTPHQRLGHRRSRRPSFKVEVIADGSGKWCGNGLAYATREEAESYARDLASRWMAVRQWRVVESDQPVNIWR